MSVSLFDQLRAAPLHVQRLFCEPATPARQPVYTLPTASDLFDELTDRLEKHVIWHADRARARCLRGALTEGDAMLSAVTDLLDASGDDARDAAFEEAHQALARWKGATERESMLSLIQEREALHQCIELDQGDIGALLLALEAVEALRRAERGGATVAGDLLAVSLSAPGYPPPAGV